VAPGTSIEEVPGFSEKFRKTQEAVAASGGGTVDVYSTIIPPDYGRVVPGAVRLTDEQAIGTILNPEFPPNQLLILSPDSDIELTALSELPQQLHSRVVFESWEPGAMTMRLDPPPGDDAYVVVSENWYPDWKATVDGDDAEVVRGDMTLITVPVSAGAEVVELKFDSADYRIGKLVTFLSLVLVAVAVSLPRFVRRRADG
jgi:hypothetical protein